MRPFDPNVTLRYFQARRVVHDTAKGGVFNLDAFPKDRPAGPIPARISERVLLTPDEAHYLCSASKSLYVEVLEYNAEFDEDVSDEVRDWWDDQLHETLTGNDDYYVYFSDVVETYSPEGPVEFTGFFPKLVQQGEYPLTQQLDAVYDAFANHLI